MLEEMRFAVEGRKSVQKCDLERLAGKMVFVCCSVVHGGRTFMRELLNSLRSKRHWAHLSAGFHGDLAWWKELKPIPPAFSVPWHYLSSDASGDTGLGECLPLARDYSTFPCLSTRCF